VDRSERAGRQRTQRHEHDNSHPTNTRIHEPPSSVRQVRIRGIATARGTSDIKNRFFSRAWVRMKEDAESLEHRRRNLAGLAGRVIELGAGDGRNFAFYPTAVTEVLAVEPEPYLRERAEEAARKVSANVTVVPGVADRLPAEDASCDAGVASLVLCSVPDQSTALAELRRVIKPGGELHFFEHVHSSGKLQGRVEDTLTHVWPHLFGGCRLNRDTEASIAAAGFEIDQVDRFPVRFAFPTMKIAHILGIARRPA